MDASRLRTGEIVAGIGGFALFVFLFFDWFGGGPEVSGNVLSGTASISHPGISGWNALVDLPGFLIMLSGFAGMALAALAGAGRRVNIPVRRGAITALLGALAVLLILWRMVAGTPTLKIGIFLGLGAAVAITWGALLALAEDGFEPLVAVLGGRTRAASSASAPAPTTTAAATAPAATPPKRAASSGGSASRKRTTPSKRSSPAKRSTTSRSTTKRSTTKKKSSSSGSRSSPTRSRSGSSRKKSPGSKSSRSKRSSSRKK